MTSKDSEISCYLTHLLLQFSKKHNLKDTLNDINVPEEVLDNPHEWTSAPIWTKMAENIEREFKQDPNVIFNLGKDFFNLENNSFLPFFLRIAPLKIILRSLSNYSPKHSIKIIDITFKVLEKNKVMFEITPKKPEHFSRQMCDFNRGATHAILSLKGFESFEISEQTCAPRNGARSCQHIISWKSPSSPVHRLKTFFSSQLRERNAIINRLEENHLALQNQYKEILSMRDFYSHIMDSMGEAIVWLNTEGIITFSNRAFYELIAEKFDQIKGNRFEKYLANDFHAAQFKLLCSDARQKPFTPVETEFTFNENQDSFRIGAATILWVPGEHYPPGFIISIRDITDKRHIERQLSAAEDRYRSLYENSPALIVAMNLDGNFIYANPAMTEQSGYKEDELLTMHFKDLIAPQADYNVDYLLQELMKSPGNLREVHFKTKSGEWKCIALNSYHIFDNEDKLAGIAGIGIDVTETKRLNEQLIRTQRMELLGQLAGGLAHDFGNVITSINGFAKLISIKSTDEKISRYAQSIEKSGLRAQELVKSLLAFSRNDTSANKIFDVVPIIAEVSDMLVGASSTNVSIIQELPEYTLHINGDPGKIHQCILNLGINARDALNGAKGTITLRAQRIFGQSEAVQIQVEDTGTGIPPDIIDKIYDPFFSTKEKKAGTGLGLSVVYGIIKSHNGEIIVDSHPGEGTIFTLEFPSEPPPGKK